MKKTNDINNDLKKINETHLGYIQNVISRMGQNSFQAKTWAITIISALVAFYLTETDKATLNATIIIAIAVSVLFCFIDVYYLYLERGYRYLYNLVAELSVAPDKQPIKPYDMSIPSNKRGFKEYFKSFLSFSTGGLYLFVILGLIAIKAFIK